MLKPLSRCRNVVEVGRWMRAHGISPGENRHFGHVANVHSTTSWHYRLRSGAKASNLQGEMALDVNDNDIRDTWWGRIKKKIRPRSETETLTWLYYKLLRTARRKGWPLAEMFFNGGGRIRGYKAGSSANVSVPGHTTHLHVAWSRFSW